MEVLSLLFTWGQKKHSTMKQIWNAAAVVTTSNVTPY